MSLPIIISLVLFIAVSVAVGVFFYKRIIREDIRRTDALRNRLINESFVSRSLRYERAQANLRRIDARLSSLKQPSKLS